MKMHKLKITTPGHIVIFNGKKIRTPVTFEKIKEEDLLYLNSQIRQQNLKYSLDDEEPQLTKKVKDTPAKVEELYSETNENKSTLSKLLEIE